MKTPSRTGGAEHGYAQGSKAQPGGGHSVRSELCGILLAEGRKRVGEHVRGDIVLDVFKTLGVDELTGGEPCGVGLRKLAESDLGSLVGADERLGLDRLAGLAPKGEKTMEKQRKGGQDG